YRYARTTGFVYQAVLRGELSARLGVAWGAVRNGQADIAGVPRAVLREFSRRRVEIEAHLAARGEGSSKAAQGGDVGHPTGQSRPASVVPTGSG
ncbi:MAG: relaxase domain-containing protein, partial [Actinomycetota bacterium]|nr:relaxase domain-containing protein [Actinomycetota bacterium]